MRNVAIGLVVTALAGAVPVAAQDIHVGPNGVRTGDVVVDSTGVRTGGTRVDASGVHTGQPRAGGAMRGGGLTLVTNGNRGTRNCGGGTARIVGNANTLTLVNCAAVSVPGNSNRLTVRFTGAGSISVTGNNNQLRYQTPRGVRARVTVVGNRNVVTRG